MRRVFRVAGTLLACTLWLGLHPAARAVGGEVTAVSAKVSDDYMRAKLADGSFAPEAYAFGEGGLWSFAHDDTIDKLHFLDVARTIAPALAGQHFVPARDPKATKLLIMVYWGTTAGTSDGASSSLAYQELAASQKTVAPTLVQQPNGRMGTAPTSAFDASKGAQQFDENAAFLIAAENHLRDLADIKNARLLGFDEAYADSRDLEMTALRFRRRDLLDELEDSRYFVVLMAYDFQLLWKEKKHKLLWETRFSIREHRNDFSQELAAMAESASRYFGQDSHGLIHKTLPETRVEIGEPTYPAGDSEPDKK